MRNITFIFVGVLVVLSCFWLIADTQWIGSTDFFVYRRTFIQYSGIISIGVMSVGIILASRPAFIEKTLGGLDKAYRLHKWLGITALIFAVSHWLLKEGTHWLIDLELLTKPIKKPRPEETQLLFKFFQDNRGLAKDVGEWAFYAFLVLVALALIKKVPYRFFVKTHRLLAIIYLALVFHTVCLINFNYWQQPLIFIMLPLMLAGSIAAFASLFRRTGKSRRAMATITALDYHQHNRVLALDIQLKGPWPGHQPGQFAFLTFDKAEGPHPFTIASAWKNDGNIGFLIKSLGDYTRQLPTLLNTHDLLNIEGPYGRFNFTSDKAHHIWIAGGIGLSPFIARMKALADKNTQNDTDLFYCTSEPDEAFIREVSTLADAANVTLHIYISQIHGHLGAAQICERVSAWKKADIWFCGPNAFGLNIKKHFDKNGIAKQDFHQELFEMR